MLRSLVAMVLAGYTSIPQWVALMRAEPFYAVVSGFAPHDVPGIGTFYDLFDRLLGGPPRPGRRRTRRLTPARKQQLREDKKRPGPKHTAIVARLAEALLAGGPKAQHWRAPPAERLVNALLDRLCVQPAVRTGLLPEKVGVSGDGMKVATFANSYGHKACACPERQCGCPRRFADPDASTGYDAYHTRWVYGHNLYQLTGWSHGSKVELPIYLMRATGARSDAVLGPLALARARQRSSVTIQQACFDGAHDASAFYDLGQQWNVSLFIPLAGAPRQEAGGDGGQDSDGTPLCLAGRRMYPDGYQQEYRRHRWRCPLMKGPERGDVLQCPHRAACSTAKAGRIVYTHPEQDPRVHCTPPRGTDGWQAVYDHRTASERTNSRQAYHLHLKATRTRGGNRWLMRLLLCAIAQYLLAWQQHQPGGCLLALSE